MKGLLLLLFNISLFWTVINSGPARFPYTDSNALREVQFSPRYYLYARIDNFGALLPDIFAMTTHRRHTYKFSFNVGFLVYKSTKSLRNASAPGTWTMGNPEGKIFSFRNLSFSSIWIPRWYLVLFNSSIPDIERLLRGELMSLLISDWSDSTSVGLYWISTIFWNIAKRFYNIYRKGLTDDDNKNSWQLVYIWPLVTFRVSNTPLSLHFSV